MNTQLSQATKNPVAIITGAGQGMGKSVAHTLAQQGLQIAVNDIHFDAANATVAELHASNINAIAVAGDVTNKTDLQNMKQQTIDY